MRIVVQRVLRGQVSVNSEIVSQIDRGLMVLCGITHGDNVLDIEYLAQKLLKLKLWPDAQGKAWSSNLVDNSYEILLVSQFTLYHQLKGTKPDFHDAMHGDDALPLYNSFLEYLKKNYHEGRVKPGAFGQYMNVEIVGDGPVTLVIDSIKDEKAQRKLEKQIERENAQKAKQMMKGMSMGGASGETKT